jgi:hypothetical protein
LLAVRGRDKGRDLDEFEARVGLLERSVLILNQETRRKEFTKKHREDSKKK